MTVSQDAPPTKPKSSVPAWIWAFVLACLGIPIVTGGNPVAVAISICAMVACFTLGRNLRIPLAMRIVGCVVITIACYIGVIFLVSAIVSARRL